jgi:hypothetical protein
VTRTVVLGSEAVTGLRGLASLTAPGPDEPVVAVIDVAVIGARGDGKTQFIVHAIRTLCAAAPALGPVELALNRDVMALVMNARAPRTMATPPGVVPHYVFRVPLAALTQARGWAAQVGGRGLLGAATAIGGCGALLAGAIGLGLPALLAGAVGVGVGSVAAGRAWAQRRAPAHAEVEIVLWDVAGEHVYADTAADYHGFLDALVRARRATADGRGHAFAPVLVCNPLALGDHVDDSPYARLRRLLPIFGALDVRSPALVAINRWCLVEAVCAGGDRDERVVIDARTRDQDGGGATAVVRGIVHAHCDDPEDGRDGAIAVRYLRYDAGARCEAEVRATDDGAVIDYRFDDGPGAFTGAARRDFLRWLAALATRPAPAMVRAAEREVPAAGAAIPVASGSPGPAVAPGAAAAATSIAPTTDEVWQRRDPLGAGPR